MSKTNKQAIQARYAALSLSADERYNERYNNDVYQKATAGKSVADSNLLIDDAMFLCGSQYYRYSETDWDEDALAFLVLFC